MSLSFDWASWTRFLHSLQPYSFAAIFHLRGKIPLFPTYSITPCSTHVIREQGFHRLVSTDLWAITGGESENSPPWETRLFFHIGKFDFKAEVSLPVEVLERKSSSNRVGPSAAGAVWKANKEGCYFTESNHKGPTEEMVVEEGWKGSQDSNHLILSGRQAFHKSRKNIYIISWYWTVLQSFKEIQVN